MSFFDYMTTHETFFSEFGNKIQYNKNQYIVTSHDESPWVYFLVDGLVKITFTLANGDNRIIGYFLPGMSFAKSGSFFIDSGGDLEYQAVKKSSVYRLPREAFLQNLSKSNQFNQEYINWLLKSQILLIERIVYQGENTIKNKLLKWLLFMSKYYGEQSNNSSEINIALTQDLIADFLHITRESAGSTLRELVKENLISINKKKITINNLQVIKNIVE